MVLQQLKVIFTRIREKNRSVIIIAAGTAGALRPTMLKLQGHTYKLAFTIFTEKRSSRLSYRIMVT